MGSKMEYEITLFDKKTEELVIQFKITEEQFKRITGIVDPTDPEIWGEHFVEAFAGIYSPVK